MRLTAPLCLLLAACGSDPDRLEDGGGGTTDDVGGTEGDVVGESATTTSTLPDEGESGSGSGGGVDLSCLESSPVMEATCGVLWAVVTAAPSVPISTDDHDVWCAGGSGWAIMDVVLEWHGYAEGEDPQDGPVVRADALPCGPSDPPHWLVDSGGGLDSDRPRAITLSWRATWGDDELVYACERYGEGIAYEPPWPKFGEEGIMQIQPPVLPASAAIHMVECCLVSGTPTDEYPSTPC